MPDPFLPGLVRIVASGQLSDQDRWTNTFHVDDETPLTQARANVLAVNTMALYNNFEDRCVSYWTLDDITVYDRSGPGEPSFVAGIGAGVQGTSTDPCFQQISVVLSWLTGLPGRSFRGRTYLAGIANDQYVSDGGPLLMSDATVRGAILDGAEAYFDAMFADDAIPIVFSRVGAGDVTAIVQARVGSVPDTQRRRRDQIEEDYLDRDLG